MSRPLSLVFCAGILAACGTQTDLTGQTDATRLSFGAEGCAVTYTGGTRIDPNAIDLTCPGSLLPLGERPLLHLSAPLSLANRLNIEQPLKDPQFTLDGSQLGHYVVAYYYRNGRRIICDPRDASGSILYSAIPSPGKGGHFIGQFSADASLNSCRFEDNGTAASKLALFGSFDIDVPAVR